MRTKEDWCQSLFEPKERGFSVKLARPNRGFVSSKPLTSFFLMFETPSM